MTYRRTATLLMERFPALGLLAGTWSRGVVADETAPPLNLAKAEVLYFYGLGKGQAYFHCKQWLQQDPARQLIILEDDPSVICAFLYNKKALEVLKNEQVHLELFTKKKAQIDQLATRFPSRRIEVAGLSSKKGLAALKLKLLRKTALSYALHVDRLHGDQPFSNFLKNIRHLSHSFYANGLKDAFKNVPAVVCGAGPSLQKSMDVLKTLENKALIIAGGSTIAALSSQGIMPHFAMAVDPNLEEYRRLKNSFAFEVPFLYSTRVHKGAFQTCNGPFGYMRSGIGGAPELWMEEELGLLDPLIGDFLPPETISVTGICIAYAQYLGCNPILLDGIDMAYTGNKHYASGVTDDEELRFQEMDDEKASADRIIKKKDRLGKPIYTAVRWVMESASISHFAKKHPEIQFINATEGGLGFQGIHYVPLKDAVSNFAEIPLRKMVFEKIQEHPMPANAKEIIEQKIAEMKASLEKVIEYLRILADEKKGSKVLAEMDLKEEIAYLYLFYDISQVFKAGESFWKNWLALALKYQKVFHS